MLFITIVIAICKYFVFTTILVDIIILYADTSLLTSCLNRKPSSLLKCKFDVTSSLNL
ncbi:MAG: hypothetical protein QXG12_07340 [Thermoproteota archaeon]